MTTICKATVPAACTTPITKTNRRQIRGNTLGSKRKEDGDARERGQRWCTGEENVGRTAARGLHEEDEGQEDESGGKTF